MLGTLSQPSHHIKNNCAPVQTLKNSAQRVEKVLSISPTNEKSEKDIGTISQLDQIVHIHKTDEIIFCAKDTSAESIINWMVAIDDKDVDLHQAVAQLEKEMYIAAKNLHFEMKCKTERLKIKKKVVFVTKVTVALQ